MGGGAMTGLIIGAAVGILIAGSLCRIYYQRRERQLFARLQNQLDNAIDGNYEVSEISEAELSRFENNFKRYLNDSSISKKQQKEQKEIIQQLISDIAHQTLTPISNLNLYAGLLAETCEKNDLVDTISGETEKLDFLIQSLVKLSRMENGIITVHTKETPVSLLLSSVKSLYQNKAAQKNITFNVAETDATAVFDLKWTAEAVGNIVDNAIKYTPAGGTVAIIIQNYSFFTRIDISDTGMGISEEEIPKIFSRFYRSPDAADMQGVGIGLYLARYITEQQKGYIKVASEKGKGSVFSVFLPASAEA